MIPYATIDFSTCRERRRRYRQQVTLSLLRAGSEQHQRLQRAQGAKTARSTADPTTPTAHLPGWRVHLADLQPYAMSVLPEPLRPRGKPSHPGPTTVAAAALPLGTIALAVALGDTARVPVATTLASEVLSVGIAVLCINLWEEAAWAGFFQTRLERDHNVFVAAVLTAVPFSAVHLPLRVIAGEATTWGGLAFAFLGLMIFVPIIRILFGHVLRGARDSVRLTTTALTVVVLLALRRHLARRRRAASDAGDHSGWTEAGAVDEEDRP